MHKLDHQTVRTNLEHQTVRINLNHQTLRTNLYHQTFKCKAKWTSEVLPTHPNNPFHSLQFQTVPVTIKHCFEVFMSVDIKKLEPSQKPSTLLFIQNRTVCLFIVIKCTTEQSCFSTICDLQQYVSICMLTPFHTMTKGCQDFFLVFICPSFHKFFRLSCPSSSPLING